MMRSRRSSKSLVKTGLNLFIASCIICGCSSSIKPTFFKEDIEQAIQDICKNEYKMGAKATLVNSTLWVYLPVEDMITRADKPEKYLERFEVKDNKADFKESALKLAYSIKPIPEQAKYQEYKYNKDVLEKINSVLKVIRRVLFSMDRSKQNEPNFFYLVVADIKSGFETREIFYYLDLKKVSYEYISLDEFQHRTVTETDVSPKIIGDKEGRHLNYRDISLEEFVAAQIQSRIKLKFQKPEVEANADIDKEILKIAIHTIKTYELKDFEIVELNNLLTQNKVILNQAAVWARPIEKRF